MVILRVNGVVHNLDVDPETPLLWVLNESLGPVSYTHLTLPTTPYV